jgi:hypothetical protein
MTTSINSKLDEITTILQRNQSSLVPKLENQEALKNDFTNEVTNLKTYELHNQGEEEDSALNFGTKDEHELIKKWREEASQLLERERGEIIENASQTQDIGLRLDRFEGMHVIKGDLNTRAVYRDFDTKLLKNWEILQYLHRRSQISLDKYARS